ncbi:hypothetical protein [Streptomyces sp. ML-6]|uniref:hypothetical protein n=1 Tax=Streptomyces sp. ML-6 TaxID=2982693 RepID=UPI0024BFEFE4|nr:hypothetical protein [Streptomyces sp. ML-6]MDK0521746.1 hypothetical protein [Streptomyces sp. ML-6]
MDTVVRRPVAFVAAIVLFAEAVGIVFVNAVLATVVENQDMSLAGLESSAMSTGTWAMGGVSGAYLLLCGLILLLTGIRDRAPGRIARIVLIVCAVVHGVLGALTVGLVGWAAFAVLMVVLGLIVLTLVAYGDEAGGADGPAAGAGSGTVAPVA